MGIHVPSAGDRIGGGRRFHYGHRGGMTMTTTTLKCMDMCYFILLSLFFSFFL